MKLIPLLLLMLYYETELDRKCCSRFLPHFYLATTSLLLVSYSHWFDSRKIFTVDILVLSHTKMSRFLISFSCHPTDRKERWKEVSCDFGSSERSECDGMQVNESSGLQTKSRRGRKERHATTTFLRLNFCPSLTLYFFTPTFCPFLFPTGMVEKGV